MPKFDSNKAETIQNTNSATENVNSNNNQNTAKSNQVKQKLPFTLPVLDALLYDEGFAESLKNDAQINDEELDKLRKLTGEAVAALGENEMKSGSTRNAERNAENKIRQMFGDEKADKIFELVTSRWNAGELNPETALNNKPNSIPADTRIVVNAPAYRMDVFQDGNLVKTYKIGIGYPEFPLPNGLRKADTIIFNPTWTPPDEPWVKGKFKPYKKVEAGSKLNPLGLIKIPIGLPSLIHGGKQKERLGNFASHGCVGLTNDQVEDFSLILSQVSGTELDKSQVLEFLKERGKTKNVELAKTIPVELRYETIVVENGILIIYRDVYERGTNNEENLRKVFEVYGLNFDQLEAGLKQNILKSIMEMNKDADGKPISETTENIENEKNNESSKVTKNIKGQKEI
ncbi:MAG TPA: L,D-transpeptidase, partial [Pyrinomonadaceae bacterium]|nr:L,D-transpeptidase [Pyrinomonadaceae bacterium]